MSKETELLRAVYEAARSVLRYNGVNAAQTERALDALDGAVEAVKEFDAGYEDDEFPPVPELPPMRAIREGVEVTDTSQIAEQNMDSQGFWRKLWRRLLCPHKLWRLVGIEWDGTSQVVCSACGKKKRVPLQ